MSGHWPHDNSTDLEPEALSTKLPARPKNEIYYELKSIGEMQALSPSKADWKKKRLLLLALSGNLHPRVHTYILLLQVYLKIRVAEMSWLDMGG